MQNVVLVVDMLNGFRNIGNLANPRMDNIIPNVVDLIKKKHREGYTIIFLGDSHKENDEEFKTFPPHCIEGTEETELIVELQPFISYPNVKYIKKRHFSGLFNTMLGLTLDYLSKPQEIIVVGVCTDICVLHTVADLLMRDYHVIVPKDCVETFDTSEHKADEINKWALAHMALIGAVVTNLGMRKQGQPLFLPHELGYACPICGSSDEVNLHWSEYKFFLWCKKCNLDIPSILCVKYCEPKLSEDVMTDEERIKKATKLFLDCIEEVKTEK